MDNKSPLFTIFTGTYNSEDIIHRVFKSVKSQTFKNFEWIIIDDYSSDKTVNVIDTFIKKNKDISIQFIKHQKNCGVKHSRKEALGIAKGTYFITWDHDDEQFSNQLEIYHSIWSTQDDVNIANIFAKMTDQDGHKLGKDFPKEPYISDYINLHNDYLVGDKRNKKVVEHHVCVKTDKYLEVLRYFEKNADFWGSHVPNGGDIWGSIAYLGYKTICTNQVVRKKYIFEEGRVSMSNQPRNSNPQRIYFYKLLWINYWEPKLKKTNPKWSIRNVFAAGMYGFLANKSFSEILKDLKRTNSKILFLILSLPAYLLHKHYN